MTGPSIESYLQDVSDYVRRSMEGTGIRSAKLATIDENYPTDVYYAGGLNGPKVTFDGDITLSTNGFACLYHAYIPTAGDRVIMLPTGNTYVIIGSVDAAKRFVMPYQSFDLPTSLTSFSTTPRILGTIDILDPGYTYHVEAYGQAEMGSTTAGTRWDAQIMYTDAISGNTQIAISPIVDGVTVFTRVQGLAVGITGPITLRLELRRVSGAANGQITQFNSSFYAKVLPAKY